MYRRNRYLYHKINCIMKIKTLIMAGAVAAGSILSASAATTKESKAVRDIITKVNDHWQATHPAEHNAFWDEAAYHTGNMEAYSVVGNPEWLDYSLKWAEHNDWKGAKGNDRSKW